MRKVVVSLIGVAVFLLAGGSPAWPQLSCDFLTAGGFLVRSSGKANFGLDGGCKNGSLTGQLNYIDHGTGLSVQGTSITGYFFAGDGARVICGTAGTNQFGDVDWAVQPTDVGEPGRNDGFVVLLRAVGGGDVVYLTGGDLEDSTLGGPGSGGGNIQLHKPQADFLVGSCPALGF